MAHLLKDRAIIALSGADTRTFLQGLITNDVDAVASGKPVYAALLTPQGKILFDFLIVDDGSGNLLLDCLAPGRDALIKRLTLYRLRAKVEIKPRDDLAAFASWDGTLLPGITFDDPRLLALGRRSIAPMAGGSDGYLAHRLALGVPEGSDFGSDKTFALDAGLEELHGVAFGKGCYVGQELTARMKHRGTARKRILPVESTDKSALIQGADLRADGHSIGEIASVYGSKGFTLVRLDRLEDAGAAPLDAAGIAVRMTKPDWLSA
ncbi:MAG: folate-binding protein YgfZ [Proteobacteria bacterium]|nr:folate-binding protein YgfZ [Pseudomonadota bacterium]